MTQTLPPPTNRHAWQQSILLQYGQRILQRVIALREQLAALPRPTRRKLKTATGMGLTSLALALALALAGSPTPAHAATINVDGTTCTLADAITSANSDTATGGCTAGS
ncbi:MAG: hypothetical protein KDD89_12560, partial [Anaerolineales bacterium]|nr:hypothetical protein [Anaerolineales bacterium]